MSTRFEDLKNIMRRLRSPRGCPWDREQDHLSLRPYLIEETYEVLEAIDGQDPEKLREELGDLLLQIVFHAQVAEERGTFDIEDVIESITEKLKRRHPHVFGGKKVSDSRDVLSGWERIKQQETEGKKDSSILDGVPKELPALLKAHRVQEKVSRVGFDWDHIDEVFAKVEEEMAEFRAAYRRGEKDQVEEELGDVFFSLVNLARFLETSPEDALRRTIDKFIARFKYVESELGRRGLKPHEVDLEAMDTLWNEAKFRSGQEDGAGSGHGAGGGTSEG
jgi:tetrapyrrole methylase family protein/MazG family protein